MENMKRSIRLFFATYGGLLSQILGIIAIILFSLQGINHIYEENTKKEIGKNSLSQEELEEKQEVLKNEKQDKKLISQFLDYCNNGQVEEAYEMLSDDCKKQEYKTIDIFKTEYIDKIFTYKKEYKIEKENELYKITIIDGLIESGSTEDRSSIVNYYKLEENVLDKKIYVER